MILSNSDDAAWWPVISMTRGDRMGVDVLMCGPTWVGIMEFSE